MGKIKTKQLFQIFLAVFITALILRIFFIDSFIVKGDSMSPTILNGDYVFVDKISPYFGSFKRGDIIVVKPRSMANQIIKRIIGLPEERIEITEGKIWIKSSREDKGESLVENYLNLPASSLGGPATPAMGLNAIQLDPKEYFVLGDNRYGSIDSRELGPVDEWNIEGKVFLILRLGYPLIKIF
jgi:signal peptidase I